MSDRRLLLVPILGACVFALTACPKPWPNCDSDDKCNTEGHTGVCVEGMCQECGRDSDCKSGFACRANKCVPKPECTTNAECPVGQKCENQKCVPECNADKDCSGGMTCKAGRCTPPAECSTNADCPSGKSCENGKCVAPSASTETGPCKLEVVRFDFNEFNLTADARRVLEKDAECLKSKKANVTLEGHADERGTEEYNLHLGEKRANAVKKYLATLGVDGNKLKTVSYGKERPANPGHDEAAWAENRRVEFSER